jgi:hypothetical protein
MVVKHSSTSERPSLILRYAPRRAKWPQSQNVGLPRECPKGHRYFQSKICAYQIEVLDRDS